MDLGVIVQGASQNFVGRLTRLLIHERYKFMWVDLGLAPADWAGDTKPASFKLRELAYDLMVAARENDADKLSVVERHAALPLADGE